MWGLDNLNYGSLPALPPWLAALAVLGLSLLGSAHCAGMCGVIALGASRSQLWLYHLGRLLTYVMLAGLVGLVGQSLFALMPTQMALVFRWLGFFLVVGMVAFSILGLMGSLHWRILPDAWTKKISTAVSLLPARGRAFGLGLLSGLLPCGWLHMAILGTLAVGSLPLAVAMMVAFWAGTIPALELVVRLKPHRVSPLHRRWLFAAVVLLVAATALQMRWVRPTTAAASSPSPASTPSASSAPNGESCH